MDAPQKPPKNKGGRPRVVDRGVLVSTWLPARDYDRIRTVATRHDLSISRVLRLVVAKQLK